MSNSLQEMLELYHQAEKDRVQIGGLIESLEQDFPHNGDIPINAADMMGILRPSERKEFMAFLKRIAKQRQERAQWLYLRRFWHA